MTPLATPTPATDMETGTANQVDEHDEFLLANELNQLSFEDRNNFGGKWMIIRIIRFDSIRFDSIRFDSILNNFKIPLPVITSLAVQYIDFGPHSYIYSSIHSFNHIILYYCANLFCVGDRI